MLVEPRSTRIEKVSQNVTISKATLRGSENVVSFKVLNYSFADISLEHLYNCNVDGTVIFGI